MNRSVTVAPPAVDGATEAVAPERTVFRARKGQVGYGFSIGMLMLDCNIPFVPGDVGNASTYDFPVQFLLVPGATGDAVVGRQDPALEPRFVEAAQELVAQGVRAITGDCAYMGAYQDAVADSVEVPVFLSSLMQVPMVVSMLRGEDKLAVLVANGQTVSDRLLEPVGIIGEARERCVFRGLEDKDHFRSVCLEDRGELDLAQMEADMVQTAREVVSDHPDVRAFLLECSDMPPYSAAVQGATGLPVFDWIGFINYVHHAVVRHPYQGFF
jgi:hypothetical protein